MSGVRAPRNLLKIRGSAERKNPSRLKERGEAPQDSRKLGNPPKYLDTETKRAWRRIVATLGPLGTLKYADRLALERVSRLYVKLQNGSTTAADGQAYDRLMAKFGWTPRDRENLSIPQPKKINPFAEF